MGMTLGDWRELLLAAGRRALNGEPVTLVPLAVPAVAVDAACGALLRAVDDVTAAAVCAPRGGRNAVPPLEDALVAYLDAVSTCVGIALYAPAESDLLREVADEISAARDALRGLGHRHWNAEAFYAAARAAEAAYGRGWKPQTRARFSLAA